MNCLDPDTALAFLSQGLSPLERAEVEAHLSQCQECRSWVTELAEGDEFVGAPEIRSQLGRYELVDTLGAGATAAVYRAYDPALQRHVALKVLHQGDDRVILSEARALAKFSHPNVVQVYDAGEVGDEVFLAMELVEGTTLSEWIAETNPDFRRVLEILLQAGEGLSALHAQGWIHRDFKPANVILGEDGRVRVCDFGLAALESRTPKKASDAPAARRAICPQNST